LFDLIGLACATCAEAIKESSGGLDRHITPSFMFGFGSPAMFDALTAGS